MSAKNLSAVTQGIAGTHHKLDSIVVGSPATSIDLATKAMQHSNFAMNLFVAKRGLDLISGEIEPPSLTYLVPRSVMLVFGCRAAAASVRYRPVIELRLWTPDPLLPPVSVTVVRG